jgi:hypothetical protein
MVVSRVQGAYGKLKTHSESKVSQLLRLDEVFSARYYTVGSPLKGQVDPLRFGPDLKEDVLYCDDMLGKVCDCAPFQKNLHPFGPRPPRLQKGVYQVSSPQRSLKSRGHYKKAVGQYVIQRVF